MQFKFDELEQVGLLTCETRSDCCLGDVNAHVTTIVPVTPCITVTPSLSCDSCAPVTPSLSCDSCAAGGPGGLVSPRERDPLDHEKYNSSN